YGGVVPELASRQHIKTIDLIVKESLFKAKVNLGDIDLFAVTQGPGLIGSLLVGLSFVKSLAFYFDKPIIGVNHIEAHIEAAFLENPDISFPVLALVVSGGHTSLYYMSKELDFKLIGKTRDDAAGEALDKIAKFLNLGYPGGPIIDRLSKKGNPEKFSFSLPKIKDKSFDFSFSGLKTAALKYIKEMNIQADSPQVYDLLASFQDAIINFLIENVKRALSIYKKINALIVCGGVARNSRLREKFLAFCTRTGMPLYIPSPRLCTDNAAMVASLAYKKYMAQKKFDLNLDAFPRIQSAKGKKWK
ncbi:tRNA (adenosine(37)-N6)-threonylcarbamoyltransferase complex transferase subunit TsaD, partial [Candidatus Aminicenantes bacterium AC-335-O07]|nr:tRNA (adenosine(37)-N6)-threonylcarbamoyltransferase complex transferase subunit TsaD [Candidatus Aminicenantes bacterium AC-335-O07]